MTAVPGSTGLARILPALAAYHLLLLAGAVLLLLVGVGLADRLLALPGIVLVAAGLLTQFAVVRWSLRRSPRSAAGSAAIEPRPMLCTTCGWKGTASSIFCPRCHRVLVRPFRD